MNKQITENSLTEISVKAVNNLKSQNKTLALAESCTGGLVSKFITDVSGASAVYEGGICSYSNKVKMNILGVNKSTLDSYGAVSEQTAREMAEGVRRIIGADIGIGITGIAGPDSDNTNKPVGLIYIAICDGNKTQCTELKNNFTENVRMQNRYKAAKTALNLLVEYK
ncbi:MAG: CinA family protein [Acutalibacteraceae bacterium]